MIVRTIQVINSVERSREKLRARGTIYLQSPRLKPLGQVGICYNDDWGQIFRARYTVYTVQRGATREVICREKLRTLKKPVFASIRR